MKAITLIQPWSWAVAHGGKRVENRSWFPPKAMLGQRVAIHAGGKLDRAAVDDVGTVLMHEAQAAQRIGDEAASRLGLNVALELIRIDETPGAKFVHGAVESVAMLAGAVRFSGKDDSEWLSENLNHEQRELVRVSRYRNRAPGTVCFLLTDVVVLERPVPCKGALGFWNLPESAERAVLRQLEAL